VALYTQLAKQLVHDFDLALLYLHPYLHPYDVDTVSRVKASEQHLVFLRLSLVHVTWQRSCLSMLRRWQVDVPLILQATIDKCLRRRFYIQHLTSTNVAYVTPLASMTAYLHVDTFAKLGKPHRCEVR
jgi:hypothetical protein